MGSYFHTMTRKMRVAAYAMNIFCCHEKTKPNVLTVVLSGEYKVPRH